MSFVQPNQVLISADNRGRTTVEAKLLSFPSAKLILKTKLPPGGLFPATDQAFVIVRPFGLFTYDSDPIQRTAAVEYRSGEVIISGAQTLDVLGDRYVTEELPSGKVGLYRRHKGLEATIAVD